MKLRFIVFIILIMPHYLAAQALDSIDNIVFRTPPEWKVNRQPTYTELTLFDNSIGGFCMVAIYQQQPAIADNKSQFLVEWQELVEKNFPSGIIPLPQPVTGNGQSSLQFDSPVHSKEGKPYFVQLNMYNCGTAIQS